MMRSAVALSLLAAVVLSPALRAAPLDKEGCNQLKTEQSWLEQAGTRGFMSKGPQWAKTNLEPGKLDQVRRLLEVDEQLLFRCHGRPLVNLPKDPDPDPAAREPDGTDGAKGPAAKPGKAPKAQKKDAPKKKPALKKAAAPATDQPAQGAAKPDAAPAAASPVPKAEASKPAGKTDGTPEGKSEASPEKKTTQKPAAGKKTKAKRKVDDAYRSPAVNP